MLIYGRTPKDYMKIIKEILEFEINVEFWIEQEIEGETLIIFTPTTLGKYLKIIDPAQQ